MSACSRNRVLFRGTGLRVDVHRCASPRAEPSAVEVSDAHYVVLVQRGAFEKRAGSRSVLATPASVVFFEPSEEYRVAHPIGGGDECTAIRVEEPLLAEILDALSLPGADRPRLPIARSDTSRATAHYRQWELLAALRRSDRDPAAREEEALELVAMLIEDAHPQGDRDRPRKSATEREHEQLVARAIEVLADRFVAPPSLAALARELCASQFHLCHIFRARTGLSIHEYVTQLRVREALRRVAEGERDLLRLALDLGFSHHGHLGRAFKRAFGTTPSGARALLAR